MFGNHNHKNQEEENDSVIIPTFLKEYKPDVKLMFGLGGYTEKIFMDTPANRKLGRVGMTKSQWKKELRHRQEKEVKQKELNKKLDEWLLNLPNEDARPLLRKAARKAVNLGIKVKDLPVIYYSNISPEKDGFQPIAIMDNLNNQLTIGKNVDFEKKGEEYKKKNWNSQKNPFLHEIAHFIYNKIDPKYIQHKDREIALDAQKDIKKLVSERALKNQGEFEAELIAGILSGKKYPYSIVSLSSINHNRQNNPIAKKLFLMGIKDNDKELWKAVEFEKAYTEGIYADTPANRKLGRVGMTYAAYAEKLKDEEENTKEKKNYIVGIPDGDFFSLTEGEPCSKDKIIEKTIELAKNGVKYGNDNKCRYDIEEDLDWDKIDDNFDFSKTERLSVEAEKNGSNIDITVIDWHKSDGDSMFIRNDKLEREQKKREREFKKKQEKDKEEFERKFGWIRAAIEEKEKYKNLPQGEQIKEYVSSVRDKEVRKMTEDAVLKMVELGVNVKDLPPIEYKYIEKQKQQGIHPLAGYDSMSNKLLISSRHDFKETADRLYNLGYNSQPNPILHELGHWLIHKTNPKHGLHKEESVPLINIREDISGRAAVNRAEFEAELIAGILAGKKYKPQIMFNSDLRFNKDEISKKIYKMGLDGEDIVWKHFHKIDARINDSTKRRLQSFLNSLGIDEFKLGYGGYLFSQKDKEGIYHKLTLNDIRELDFKKIKDKLDEEKLPYEVKYKIPSSKEGFIKDLNIEFNYPKDSNS